MAADRDPIKAAQRALGAGGKELYHLVPGFLRDIIQDRMWAGQSDVNGRPFTSFKAFAEAPLWEGLGTPLHRLCDYCWEYPEVVRLIQTSVAELPRDGEVGRGRDSRSDATPIGRGTAYLAARLKRDRPDLIEAIQVGSMTVRQAAKAAGIVKPPDPLKQLCRWWKLATPEQKVQFDEWRNTPTAGDPRP